MKFKISVYTTLMLAMISITPSIAGQNGMRAALPNQGIMFHAKGQHQCWSAGVIGYYCEVEGNNFHDSNEAFYRLKNQNCCKTWVLNGRTLTDAVSINFKITKFGKYL